MAGHLEQSGGRLTQGFCWYRHSDQPVIDGLPPDLGDIIHSPVQPLAQVKAEVGDNYITHAVVSLPDALNPSMVDILSKVTHLRIRGVVSSTSHSLSQLPQLKVLDLSYNNFSDGVPRVVGEVKGLCELNLRVCKITDLPESLGDLKNLTALNLSQNSLTRLPPIVYKLKSLCKLSLLFNQDLTTIHEEILELTALKELDCRACLSLTTPPYAVCEQGIEAVKKYFTDLKVARGVELTLVPVAIIGQAYSGKTSIVKSMQKGKRQLTIRKKRALVDGATRVFDVADLSLADSRAKLIVVNMEEFDTLATTEGTKEATRKVCFNWMAHLYLACPELGPPLLALTHIDMLNGSTLRKRRQDLLHATEEIRNDFLDEEETMSGFWEGKFSSIKHLSDRPTRVFSEDDIVEFGNDLTVTSNIVHLKEKLNTRCKELNMVIPRLWEDVDTFIHQQKDAPYVSLADIMSHFSSGDCQIILKYMHNTGSILWFQQFPALRDYIFHRIPAISAMINVLFHHCADEQWKQRLEKFKKFRHEDRIISREEYKKLMVRFNETGELDEAVLRHLLQTESIFSPDMAVELLRHFYIIHGPIRRGSFKFFIIPYFSTSPMGEGWKADGRIQQRLEIHLEGFVFPRYAHYLITGLFLNRTVDSFSETSIRCDGATVRHGGSAIHLIHDFDGKKIILQTSTGVQLLGKSWRLLLETTKHMLEHISDTWKACLVSIHTYCSHCLFLEDPNPDQDVNPVWLHPRYPPGGDISVEVKVCPEPVYNVKCRRHADMSNDSKPTVPSPLVLPYYELTEKEISEVDNYLSQIATQHVHQPEVTRDARVDLPALPVEERGGAAEEDKALPVEDVHFQKLTELSVEVNAELRRCLSASGVPHYQLMQNPREDKKLKVLGERVETLQEKLSCVARQHGFEVSTQNITIDLAPNGLPLLSNWIESCAGVIRNPQYSINLGHRPIVRVNAIMQGRLASRQRNTEEFFALTTAHAALNDEQRDLLDGCTAYFKEVFNRVSNDWFDKEYYMAVNGGDNVDINLPPRWLYKYWVREGDNSQWSAYQDIAFVNLVQAQVVADGLVDSGNRSIASLEQHSPIVEDAYIEEISSEQEAKRLIGRRIVCRGISGTIIFGSDIVGEDRQKNGHTIGTHLEFVFDDRTQRLEPGDCGSLLFLADKRDGKLPIIGMFFGQLIHDKQVHCALILSWNIQLATQVQALKLKDIRLAGCYPGGDIEPSQISYNRSESLPLPTMATGDDDMDVEDDNLPSTSAGVVGMAAGYKRTADNAEDQPIPCTSNSALTVEEQERLKRQRQS